MKGFCVFLTTVLIGFIIIAFVGISIRLVKVENILTDISLKKTHTNFIWDRDDETDMEIFINTLASDDQLTKLFQKAWHMRNSNKIKLDKAITMRLYMFPMFRICSFFVPIFPCDIR